MWYKYSLKTTPGSSAFHLADRMLNWHVIVLGSWTQVQFLQATTFFHIFNYLWCSNFFSRFIAFMYCKMYFMYFLSHFDAYSVLDGLKYLNCTCRNNTAAEMVIINRKSALPLIASMQWQQYSILGHVKGQIGCDTNVNIQKVRWQQPTNYIISEWH